MSSNMERLGNVLVDRMKRTSRAAVPMGAELGTINANLSLTPDSLRIPIPKGDYLVSLTLTDGTFRTGTETENEGVDDHSHQLPNVFRGLKAGDRVLLVWCGNDPVVVSIVVKS